MSRLYAGAMLSLLHEADAALGRPARLDVVDMGLAAASCSASCSG